MGFWSHQTYVEYVEKHVRGGSVDLHFPYTKSRSSSVRPSESKTGLAVATRKPTCHRRAIDRLATDGPAAGQRGA
jgi:hypothetical protein